MRWTIGDVHLCGFETLRASLLGARRVFGAAARFAVCVNSLRVAVARERVGTLPFAVEWIAADGRMPAFLAAAFDGRLAEGAGWKLAPPRLFPGWHELSLDNDCILWQRPPALTEWLRAPDRCVMAADVVRAFGRFSALCPPTPLNAGIRGLPPGFDLGRALERVLRGGGDRLSSELDEQGLQAAALASAGAPLVVPHGDVSLCSPFPPHQPELGACGAHFLGLNAHALPWAYHGVPASELTRSHWHRHKVTVFERVAVH